MAEGYEPQPVSGVEVFDISSLRKTEYLNAIGDITRYGRVVNWNAVVITVTTEIPRYFNILAQNLPERFRPKTNGVTVLLKKHNNPAVTQIVYVNAQGGIETQEIIPTGDYFASGCWIA